MRTLIVDDEVSARKRLRRMLGSFANIEIVGEAVDGLDAIVKLEALRPDLVFLDIAMPGMDGFEVLRNVSIPLVIFATGFDQHALQAFEANALAYLLKPIEEDRLKQAVERAFLLNAKTEGPRIRKAIGDGLRQIVCRKKDRVLLVPPDQICWFQVESGLVKAHTVNESFVVTYQLNELEARLGEDFFRARREALVNLRMLKELRPFFKSGFVLVMADQKATEITVSERQVRVLRQRIPGL